LYGIELVIKQLISDSVLRSFLEPISLVLELIGVAIIVYGAIVTIIFLIKAEARSVRQAGQSQYEIKQQFTTRILTGLEFFIAGDVLKTIINPTLESLAVVGAIVAIRAALTYLLNRELKDERERDEHRSSKDVRSDEDTKTTTAKSNSAVTNQEE
jgi:uncharacterized membrane protein